jgi:thioredoxin-related protein
MLGRDDFPRTVSGPADGMSAPAAVRSARSGPTRGTPVLLLALAGLLLVARVALGIYEHVRPVERPDHVEWREPAAGEAEAGATGRLLLYFFTRDGDPGCRQMRREVFADERVAQGIQGRLVAIRVLDRSRAPGGNPPDVARLEQTYGVTEFPTLVLADPARTRSEKQAGYPGAMATTQFISQATARIVMGAARPRSQPAADSVFGQPGH